MNLSTLMRDRTASAKEILAARYRQVRAFTEQLAEPLETEDYVIQSMPDASPAKWHLAHTTWFFDTFVLQKLRPGGPEIDPHYAYLFNSYYNAAGPMHCRPRRGMISRPTVKEVYRYRRQINEQMERFFDKADEETWTEWAPVIELGTHHEQQHQELFLTDIKHMFAQNPLHPVYRKCKVAPAPEIPPLGWINCPGGVYSIGHGGKGFAFDNERPRHETLVQPFQAATRLVTIGEYLDFMQDGGYERPEFWLSLGWFTVNEQHWQAPLYWEMRDGRWFAFNLSGLKPLEKAEPVCHVSYFEADAYARWAGARLLSEAEWETAFGALPVEGNFVEQGSWHPQPLHTQPAPSQPVQAFGDVWEWTQSAYSPYPGFCPNPGALGEYNGKFMCNQYVLRGGSCASPQSHLRPTYRNFFAPDKRWQFSGIRLARDLS